MNTQMHSEALTQGVRRCNSRPRLRELRDALRRRDGARLEMHWEAVIERVWRCTGRP
jgi:hypothetical protein